MQIEIESKTFQLGGTTKIVREPARYRSKLPLWCPRGFLFWHDSYSNVAERATWNNSNTALSKRTAVFRVRRNRIVIGLQKRCSDSKQDVFAEHGRNTLLLQQHKYDLLSSKDFKHLDDMCSCYFSKEDFHTKPIAPTPACSRKCFLTSEILKLQK